MQIPFISPFHGVIVGTHQPGMAKRHSNRVMPCHELIFVRGGTLHIGEEEQTFAAEQDHWLVLHAGRYHYGTADLSPDTWFVWACFHLREHDGSSNADLSIEQTGRATRPQRLHQLFEQMLADQEYGQAPTGTAEIQLAAMFCELRYPPEVATPTRTNAQLLAQRAADYIAKHLHDNLSLTTSNVAEALHCNADYLGRVFRRHFGQTLTEFIHRQRVVDAWNKLRRTSQSIEQIAESCGFNDVRYFRRVFTKHTGMTPSIYRRMHARRQI